MSLTHYRAHCSCQRWLLLRIQSAKNWKAFLPNMYMLFKYLHSASVEGVIVLAFSVNLSFYLAILAERTDMQTWILACRSCLMVSRSGWKVKDLDQKSRSQDQKMFPFGKFNGTFPQVQTDYWWMCRGSRSRGTTREYDAGCFHSKCGFITPHVCDGGNSFDIVCVFVCVSVRLTLLAERTYIQIWILEWRASGWISRSRSYVKRSSPQGQKCLLGQSINFCDPCDMSMDLPKKKLRNMTGRNTTGVF